MAIVDVSSAESRAKVDHVLIMVHGIRDLGGWQEELSRTRPKAGIATVGIRYGYFDAFRFLFPLSWFRKAVISKVAKRVRDAQTLYPAAKFSYLAHSFGTYVVGKMLLEDPNFRANRIIFCGSVLPSDFPVAQLRNSFNAPLLNEVGTKDNWPILAASSTWGYGSAGTTGFGQPYVKDRYHNQGHGQFLTAEFARNYWIPFLKKGQIIEGVVPPATSLLRRVLSVIGVKYTVLCILGVVAVWWILKRPDQLCTDKWLSQENYDGCFQVVGNDFIPVVVEGRRSWFGLGKDVLRAKWVSGPGNVCYVSRSLLSREQFASKNSSLTSKGYVPISVRSFVSDDNTERFQATWIYVSLAVPSRTFALTSAVCHSSSRGRHCAG